MQILRDLATFLIPVVGLAPTSITAAGNTDGTLIDRGTSQGQTFLMNASIVDGTATLVILEGDESDGSDLAATASTEIITDDASLAASGVVMVGYVGGKKYIKPRVVVTDEGSLAVVASVVMVHSSNHIVGGT